MTTLRVLLDPVVGPRTLGGRYTSRMARALVGACPEGSGVVGILSGAADDTVRAIEQEIPGLTAVATTRLGAREVRAAWQHGLTVVPGTGLLHATDLVAPLGRHDRLNAPDSQVVVTIHDTRPWGEPSAMDAREATRLRALARRAERYADAIVVPSHAVARAVDGLLGVGDRIRVIAGAPRPRLRDDPATRRGLGVPERYLVMVQQDDAPMHDAIPLPAGMGSVTVLADHRVPGSESGTSTVLSDLSDEQLGSVLAGAVAVVHSDASIGFGLTLLDAMSLGTPVIHRASDEATELIAGAGLEVSSDDDLADAVTAVAEDPALADRLATLGRDRAGAFTWRDTAEKVWQLHADL